jgi:hypothetical protein
MEEKTLKDALIVVVANAGADSSVLSGWTHDLRRADDDMDKHIAAAFRDGDHDLAQEYVDRGAAMQAVAEFLSELYRVLEAA